MLQKIQKKIQELIKEKGQGIVEYALILGFVAILALVLFTDSGLKAKVNSGVGAVGKELDAMSSAINSNTDKIKVE